MKSPRGGAPWLLPRRPDDAPTAAAAARLPFRLADLGFRCSTGPLVWNRRRADLGSRAGRGRLPVVWAADIDGGRLHRDKVRDAFRYLRLQGSDDSVLVLDRPAVLVQRTTAPEQTRRLVSAFVSEDDLVAWGGRVVVENHVNVLRPLREDTALDGQTLADVLSTGTLDRVVRSLSGSVAVSAYEIESIPFPNLETLSNWNGLEIPGAGKRFRRRARRRGPGPSLQVYMADASRLRALGITVDASNLLPDAVIVDIGTTPPTFWVVEAVASDGPVTEDRRRQLLRWAEEQRIPPDSCRFLSAFFSRNDPIAKRRLKDLAVGTFAWYASEPSRELAWHEIDDPSS